MPAVAVPEDANGLGAAVGVDPDAVSFGWRVAGPGTARGVRQAAYRIVVSDSSGAVWDSGTAYSARQAWVPYAGPPLAPDTQYSWTVSVSTGGGSLGAPSEEQRFVTGLRDADWQALWLSPGPPDPLPESYTYLRKELLLGPGPVERAIAYTGAAHKYQLWVNGARADSGPCFAYPDESYYQATDVSHLLRPGEPNAVGVLHRWYNAGRSRPAAQPALILQLSVLHTDGTRELLTTDGTWREHPAQWLPAPYRNNEGGDFVESIDGRAEPIGWSEPGFDDSSWREASVLGPAGTPPFTSLYAQRTRIVEHTVRPVSLRTLPSGAVVADFGAIFSASPAVNFRRGVPGRLVPMHVGYLLDTDGHVSTTRGTQGTDLSYSYVQRGGDESFRSFDYLGFRYLEIEAPGEPLSPDQVIAYTRHAAMPDGAPASFSSSNGVLDAVWGLTARSALYCAQETFVDTPTRQRGQFLQDAYNESRVTMSAFSESKLSWQALRDFARSQARYWPDGRVNYIYPNDDGAVDIPDFTELYPAWLWRYYLHTGDAATAAAFYPVALNVTEYVWRAVDPSTGLVTRLPGGGQDAQGGLVDGPPAMLYGYDTGTVARTTVNILGVSALDNLAALADLLGIPGDAQVARARSAALRQAINSKLVRRDGLYIDGLEADGSRSSHASQQANSFALAYGIVPESRVAAVGAYVSRLGIAMGPDHGYELLAGLHAAGRDSDLVRVLSDSRRPGWARILRDQGTFTWESWTPSDLEGDSLSHGWGAVALPVIQSALLGASRLPTQGGESRLAVEPPRGGLSHAEGTVPTPAGPVELGWRRSGRELSLRLALPPNALARVVLPARRVSDVREGSLPVQDSPGVQVLGAPQGSVSLEVGSGTYAFRSSSA
jgi:alpha-L-rhamnosidase